MPERVTPPTAGAEKKTKGGRKGRHRIATTVQVHNSQRVDSEWDSAPMLSSLVTLSHAT